MPENKNEVSHVELMVALARIEGKLDTTADMLLRHLSDDREVHVDVEHRVRRLETGAARQTGIVAGIATVISGAGALLAHFWKGGV